MLERRGVAPHIAIDNTGAGSLAGRNGGMKIRTSE